MKLFNEGLAERLCGLLNNHIDALEVVGRFYNVIHIHSILTHANGVCFINVAGLIMSKATAFDVVGVVG